MMHIRPWLPAALALLVAVPAQAEIFELSSGGQITGDLLNPDETPRTKYVIRFLAGIKITLERSQVGKVTRQRPAQEEYQQIKPQFPDTVAKQWELSEWCRENHLTDARKEHLQRVIELEPEHELARRALGYSKYEGRWMTQQQRMEELGYVRYKGRWRLPQEVEVMERRRKQELAEREWFQKVKRYRKWLEDADRRQMAVQQFKEIDDPWALKALDHNLEEEPYPLVRKLYLDSVQQINSPAAQTVLVDRSLEDADREVRLTALDYLIDSPTPEVVAMYVRKLKSSDNVMINRSAYALKQLKSTAAVGPLIEALISTHKFKVTMGNPGGGMSATFSPNGGSGSASGTGGLGGLSMGSKTKLVKIEVANPDVLDALVSLTGQNFNYDVATWKKWLAAQRSPSSLDARRD